MKNIINLKYSYLEMVSLYLSHVFVFRECVRT